MIFGDQNLLPIDAMVNSYRPQSPKTFFSGIRTFMRLPFIQSTENVDLAIVGLPFDTAVDFRIGARFGPESIRSASMWLHPFHQELGLDIFEFLSCIDYGDVTIFSNSAENSIRSISDSLSPLYKEKIIPIGLGGDHSVALGELRAAAEVYGPLSLILFDSHPDTWTSGMSGQPYWDSTPFRRAVEEEIVDPFTSIMCGIRGQTSSHRDFKYPYELGFNVVRASEIHKDGVEMLSGKIKKCVGAKPVFLSFDIDFLDPAFAPGVGTPQVGGFSSWEAQALIRDLCGINIIGADVVELLPAYDQGQITALAAANIIYEMISVIAWNRKNN